MFTKTQLIFLNTLPIFFLIADNLSYRNGFNSTSLNITEVLPINSENCKRIQIKKCFYILWVRVYENATNVFNKVRIYLCKFTSSIKTAVQPGEINVKHEQ